MVEVKLSILLFVVLSTLSLEAVTPQVFSSLIALHLHKHKQASFISCISLYYVKHALETLPHMFIFHVK
jgi:hypothetical protein